MKAVPLMCKRAMAHSRVPLSSHPLSSLLPLLLNTHFVLLLLPASQQGGE